MDQNCSAQEAWSQQAAANEEELTVLDSSKVVDEEAYRKWEQQVIGTFYDKDCKVSKLVPANGQPAYVMKDKVILVLDPLDVPPGQIEAGLQQGLPPKQKLQLWHIGNKALDGVSYGLAGSEFKFPACDLGGLTNYVQQLEAKPLLESDIFLLAPAVDSGVLANDICKCWVKLAANKSLPPDFQADLAKWLNSVTNIFKDIVALSFFRPPVEHRIVVTSNDVIRQTGKYYVRNFGGGSFACESNGADSNGADLFCAITEKSVVPNYNMWNIDYECRVYESCAIES